MDNTKHEDRTVKEISATERYLWVRKGIKAVDKYISTYNNLHNLTVRSLEIAKKRNIEQFDAPIKCANCGRKFRETEARIKQFCCIACEWGF